MADSIEDDKDSECAVPKGCKGDQGLVSAGAVREYHKLNVSHQAGFLEQNCFSNMGWEAPKPDAARDCCDAQARLDKRTWQRTCIPPGCVIGVYPAVAMCCAVNAICNYNMLCFTVSLQMQISPDIIHTFKSVIRLMIAAVAYHITQAHNHSACWNHRLSNSIRLNAFLGKREPQKFC